MKRKPKPIPRRGRRRKRTRLSHYTTVADALAMYEIAQEGKRHAERKALTPVRG